MAKCRPANPCPKKVDFDDSDEVIRAKLQHAHSIDGQVQGNGMLAMLKYVLFRRIEAEGRAFVVDGLAHSFKSYEEVEQAFASSKCHSSDCCSSRVLFAHVPFLQNSSSLSIWRQLLRTN